MKSRPYQKEAEDSIVQNWTDGNRSTLVVMPTGTGKTILFASVIRRRFPKKAMVIAHRQELIWQARDKIKRVTGLTVDVEMGEYRARVDNEDMFHPRANVIVSTIQTHTIGGDGGGRISKFNPDDFGLLIIDEAHHATSASYRRVIDYYLQNPKLVVLGVTATPDRSDEEALGQVFSSVAYDYEILDAIRDGWLVPIEQRFVSIDSLDLSSVKTQAGDLNGSDLAAVMEMEKNLHGIASATIDIAGNRRGIGFAASVEHACRLSEIFNRHKFGMSSVVSAKTDKEERKKIVGDFAAGKIQFLWNCGVFTEGFDDSGVEIIAMARPTKSRALYAQMAGRGMRPAEDIASRLNDVTVSALRRSLISRSRKPICEIVDFVGNSGRHKLITSADILGGNVSDEVIQSVVSSAKKSGKPVRMNKELEEEERRQEEIKKKRLEEEARRSKLVVRSKFKSQLIDPFDVLQIKPIAERGWDRGKTLSEKQREILRKQGYDPDEVGFSRGKQLVSIIIDRWKTNKCTIKQAALLEKCGWSKDEAAGMLFEDAKKCLDSAAKNNWRKPVNLTTPPATVSRTETSVQQNKFVVPFADDDIPF